MEVLGWDLRVSPQVRGQGEGGGVSCSVSAGVQRGRQRRSATSAAGRQGGGGVPNMPLTPLQEYPTPRSIDK